MMLIAFLLQTAEQSSPAPSSLVGGNIEVVLYILLSLGLREVIGVAVKAAAERRKTNAEIKRTESQIELDGKAAQGTDYDRAVTNFFAAQDRLVSVSAQLLASQTKTGEVVAENADLRIRCERKDKEIEHLEKTLRTASETLNQRDRRIIELQDGRHNCGSGESQC